MNFPKVTITSCTQEMEKNILYNFMVMHDRKMPALPKGVRLSKKEIRRQLEGIASQAHHGVLEFVHFNFRIENCSRALQQQLTRHRTASFCNESLRVVEPRDFAKRKEYVVTKKIASNEAWLDIYSNVMTDIEAMYNQLIAIGIPSEDARNILPLGIHSTIHMSINLRNLMAIVASRLCVESQGEIQLMAKEIYKAVHKESPMIAEVFLKSKCDKSKLCNSAIPCGKYPTADGHKRLALDKDAKGNVKQKWIDLRKAV